MEIVFRFWKYPVESSMILNYGSALASVWVNGNFTPGRLSSLPPPYYDNVNHLF